MSLIDVLFPQTPPEPKGVTYVRNLMRSTKPPENRKARSREQYLAAERARYLKRIGK